MSPGRNQQKPVTPESVKVFMIIESGLIAFFTYWISSEYVHNVYFRMYVDSMLLAHITTYTAALGLGIGLAGSAIAATLYHNLKHAKNRLETLASSKIKPTVEKILASIPTLEQKAPSIGLKETSTTPSPVVTSIVPVPEPKPVSAMPVMPVLPVETKEPSGGQSS